MGIAKTMSNFIRNLTISLVALTVVAGVLIESFLALIGAQLSDTTELRWSLVLGMPVVLVLAYVCNRSLSGVLFQPAPARNNPSHIHQGGAGSDQGDSDQQQVAAA